VLVVAAFAARSIYSASVPLYAAMVALALGARRVRLVDGRLEVRELAARLGLIPLRPRELRRVRPTPLVVSATATARGLWAALSCTAPNGVCSSVGVLHRTAPIPMMRLYARNVSLASAAPTRALLPGVPLLITDDRFHPEHVITTLGHWTTPPGCSAPTTEAATSKPCSPADHGRAVDARYCRRCAC
jgi:alcohol dehydrogenase